MEHEKHVPQTGMSPQRWKETHACPQKTVHVGTHTRARTDTIMNYYYYRLFKS